MKFGKNKLCGDMPLRDFFLELYSIASLKNNWVVDIWEALARALGL